MTTTRMMPATAGWRVVDIVVTAVLGVVFGVVFWQWGVVTLPLFSAQVNPLAYLVSGMWLVPGVLAMLIVRRPGAALLAELLAAIVSALLGSYWGMDVILSGAVQGAGAAVGEWIHDMPVYYPTTAFEVQLAYGLFMVLSGILIAGTGSWLLLRALAPTGVLNQFAAGQNQPEV